MARTATVHKLATDSKPIIVPVILSGGMGSRLWPMSRAKMPKQFMGFGTNGGSSLLTVLIALGLLMNVSIRRYSY